jgi:hypothetical protein
MKKNSETCLFVENKNDFLQKKMKCIKITTIFFL